jgi:uncharacterized OB-fold protein
MPKVIPPTVGHDDKFFWDGVAEGKLLLQSCADCGTVRHPPLPMCGACNSLNQSTFESAGRGHVYSWVQSKHPTLPDEAPRIVILVELDEGPRIVSNLQGVDLADVRNDMRVEFFTQVVDGTLLPQFRPESSR